MAKPKGFRVDMSAETGVVICKDCGWRGIAFDRVSAWRQAASHERRAHPGSVLASKALSESLHRHAR